jgi:inhibitor of cysteine peptidase
VRSLLTHRRWTGCLALLSIFVTEPGRPPLAYGGEITQAMAASPSVTTFTAQDNGRAVMIPVGSSVIVRLEAIPGTGYGWQLVRNGSPQLQLETPPVFEPRSKLEAGGVEDEVFRFRVQMPGTVDLEFHYRRSWDKQTPAAKTFRVRITSE